ncbi:MAG: septal ring lytic transglycosylase RlpA family protein [Acetobacteraceae bacterium]|nr:septal ring lytic transglycosylase RlpA family protein [Acetobacteraceae bacterium]
MKTFVIPRINQLDFGNPPQYSPRGKPSRRKSTHSQKSAFRRLAARMIPVSAGAALLCGLGDTPAQARQAKHLRHGHAHYISAPPAPELSRAFYERRADQRGEASWYGPRWNGRRTASGIPFNMMAMTAAHHWLPFGTRVKVTDQNTGREVVVVVTDRLRQPNRIIDLSMGAAKALGIVHQGTANVSLQRL